MASLLDDAPDVAIKETRLHHKLGAVAEIDPDAAIVHLVRDPRAVCASMLLGRRRRTDIYPDADTFFTARTGRRLWSSRRIAEDLLARYATLELPADVPDFLRPLLVWRAAFAATSGDGERLFGERYAMVRLEDLRADPARELGRIYGLLGRPVPASVTSWARRERARRPQTSISPTTRAGRRERERSGWSASSSRPVTRRSSSSPRPMDRSSTSPRRRRAHACRASWDAPGADVPS